VADSPEGVTGDLPIAGGILRATIVPADERNRIRSVRFSGKYTAEPDGIVFRLEEELSGILIDEAPGKIEDFFAKHPEAKVSVQPGEFLTVLTLAFMKVRRTQSQAPDPAAWKKDRPS
jgi:hypothetical protein